MKEFSDLELIHYLKKQYLKEFYDGNRNMHPYSLIIQIVWHIASDYFISYHILKKYHLHSSQHTHLIYFQIYKQLRSNTPTIVTTTTNTLPRRI